MWFEKASLTHISQILQALFLKNVFKYFYSISIAILSPIWRNSPFSYSLKVRIFESNVVSVLLLGSSTWQVTKFPVFVNPCLRSIFHIYWPNTFSNVNLLKMANMQLNDVTIKRHKWSWIEHTLRKDVCSVAPQAMQWNPLDGIGRRKSRHCLMWRRTVVRKCKNLNKTWSDLKQLAQSRVRRRVGVVDALCPVRH